MDGLYQKAKLVAKNQPPSNRYYKATMDEYDRGVKNSPDVVHATEMLIENEYKEVELRFEWVKQKLALERQLLRNL
ncbi:MAG: hypothetical protein H7318_19150 [Oligoflexus sp.]|nr:hypothetical protein [Oligoflexus sp.]